MKKFYPSTTRDWGNLIGRQTDPQQNKQQVAEPKGPRSKRQAPTARENIRRVERDTRSQSVVKGKGKDSPSPPAVSDQCLPGRRKKMKVSEISEGRSIQKKRGAGRPRLPRKPRQTPLAIADTVEDENDPDPLYCLCRQVSYGDMILCENKKCNEWYHFPCVQLRQKPKGKWYCPHCRGDRCDSASTLFIRKISGEIHVAMSTKDFVGDVRIKTKTGETYIAASQRADGTWRKARRVKDGYIPQEEQPRYESRGQQMSGKTTYPVGWSPTEVVKPKKKTKDHKEQGLKKPIVAAVKPNAPITPRECIEKKINNLNRKLRDIEVLQCKSLQQRIKDGELENPEKTQLEKISRKGVVMKEIEQLTAELEKL
uniref:Partner of Y14 and mago n=1 Tax=Setaria digitata TaxID=48799 RepID=A0A915PHC2_9BILA